MLYVYLLLDEAVFTELILINAYTFNLLTLFMAY